MWRCQDCGETVEDNFDVCWNCGTSQDGRKDPHFRPEPFDTTREAPDSPAVPYKLSAPPNGFTILESTPDACIIHHQRRGMGCINTFLGIWLTIWTIAGIYLVYGFLCGRRTNEGNLSALWGIAIFWASDVAVACLLAYLLFCQKIFRMEADTLKIETTVLRAHWQQTVPRQSIRRLVQVKDGGNDDDSFSSWGLQMEAPRGLKILSRLPYDHSHWLGKVLANWAGVEFLECVNPDSLG